MKIVVCIKQVPDTVEVKIDPKTGTLIRDGVPSIINHDDKTGIEAALQLKEQLGGTVTVVSMGPPQADVALREALAMGCDEAYLVSAREFGGSDTYATSGILAAALKKVGYDIVITGRQAIDGDTAQVGPQIAEHLGLPVISYAEAIEVKESSVVAGHMRRGSWLHLSCRRFLLSHSAPSCCPGHCVSSSVFAEGLILYTSSFLGPRCGEGGTELRQGWARGLWPGYLSFGSVLAPELPSLC